MAAIFTREELMSLKKEELVDALMKVLIGVASPNDDPSFPVVSERVRRIKESLENG